MDSINKTNLSSSKKFGMGLNKNPITITVAPRLGQLAQFFYDIKHNFRWGLRVMKRIFHLKKHQTVHNLFNQTLKSGSLQSEIHNDFLTSPTLKHAVELFKQVERGTKDRDVIREAIIDATNDEIKSLKKDHLPTYWMALNHKIQDLKKYIPQITSWKTKKELKKIQENLENMRNKIRPKVDSELRKGCQAISAFIAEKGRKSTLQIIDKLLDTTKDDQPIYLIKFKGFANKEILKGFYIEIVKELVSNYAFDYYKENRNPTEEESEFLLNHVGYLSYLGEPVIHPVRYPNKFYAERKLIADITSSLLEKRESKEIDALTQKYTDDIPGLESKLEKEPSKIHLRAYIQLTSRKINSKKTLPLHQLLVSLKIISQSNIEVYSGIYEKRKIIKQLKKRIIKNIPKLQEDIRNTKLAVDRNYIGFRKPPSSVDELEKRVKIGQEARRLKESILLGSGLKGISKAMGTLYADMAESYEKIIEECSSHLEKYLDPGAEGYYRSLSGKDRIKLLDLASQWWWPTSTPEIKNPHKTKPPEQEDVGRLTTDQFPPRPRPESQGNAYDKHTHAISDPIYTSRAKDKDLDSNISSAAFKRPDIST